MCGFAGFLEGPEGTAAANKEESLRRMADSLVHRGPDDEGYWIDPERKVGLGFRRLSIIDLSPAGHQPMRSASGRYTLVFNGEIYNHLDLRHELAGHDSQIRWRGGSDTETLLAGFEIWGVEETVKRAVGMFAFGVWASAQRLLVLGRDRIGEKPIYYGCQSGTFLFGSELKALRRHPAFNAHVDRGSLCLLLRYGYVPAPYSIYEGISKLAPGTLLTISREEFAPKICAYWSASDAIEKSLRTPLICQPHEGAAQLETLLRDAVAKQMIADVPLGAFLSGGIDSSAVVALMQSQASRPVRTFSIGFHEAAYNEAARASLVARHLGTDHTEMYVRAEDALNLIPQLPYIYDEPFADSSQIPTCLLSHLTRQHVTVSLSGDAGDELFAGYNRYKAASRFWDYIIAAPMQVRRVIQRLLSEGSLSLDLVAAAMRRIPRFSNATVNVRQMLSKSATVLTSPDIESLYLRLTSGSDDPASLVIQSSGERPAALSWDGRLPADLSGIEWMMAMDLITYLPDDILVKVDRAGMAASLETRMPFLDHRVIELAWRLPLSLKLRAGQTKWILRQILYKYVPKDVIERPKMGFAVPVESWLRGALREWAESLLGEDRLRKDGFLQVAPVRKLWTEHISGRFNWQQPLWSVLMFQAWLAAEKS